MISTKKKGYKPPFIFSYTTQWKVLCFASSSLILLVSLTSLTSNSTLGAWAEGFSFSKMPLSSHSKEQQQRHKHTRRTDYTYSRAKMGEDGPHITTYNFFHYLQCSASSSLSSPLLLSSPHPSSSLATQTTFSLLPPS